MERSLDSVLDSIMSEVKLLDSSSSEDINSVLSVVQDEVAGGKELSSKPLLGAEVTGYNNLVAGNHVSLEAQSKGVERHFEMGGMARPLTLGGPFGQGGGPRVQGTPQSGRVRFDGESVDQTRSRRDVLNDGRREVSQEFSPENLGASRGSFSERESMEVNASSQMYLHDLAMSGQESFLGQYGSNRVVLDDVVFDGTQRMQYANLNRDDDEISMPSMSTLKSDMSQHFNFIRSGGSTTHVSKASVWPELPNAGVSLFAGDVGRVDCQIWRSEKKAG